MNADEYNKAELVAGRLTLAHITVLVRKFQEACGFRGTVGPRALDGKAGPNTQRELDKLLQTTDPVPKTGVFKLALPLPDLADGRRATITSSFRPADRPNHDGVDLFYRWRPGDQPSFVGDKGAATRNADGTPRWVVPYETPAVAAADGIVQIAGNSATGYRCWVDHGNGMRTGYFHLLDLDVAVGQRVTVGARIGRVGDNPADNDGRHLHFELSPSDRYAPIDPAPYLP
jgi:murein DD-endopeptidase MepM/ murein hydrolase activator NlpD